MLKGASGSCNNLPIAQVSFLSPRRRRNPTFDKTRAGRWGETSQPCCSALAWQV